MRLTFKPFDGRSPNVVPIIDEETGNNVGYIHANGVGMYRYGGIEVTLFDGKYRAIWNRYDECVGFVKGLEMALNRVASLLESDIQDTASNAA